MTTDEVRTAIKAQPFREFVLRTTSGQEFLVEHPEFVALSKGGRAIAVFSTTENAFEIVDLLLLESIRFGEPGKRRVRKSA
jgi:hypothetical protein